MDIIEKIEKLFEEVKSELALFEEDTKKKKSNKSEIIPSREELISEYNNLYQDFLSGYSDIISSFFTNIFEILVRATPNITKEISISKSVNAFLEIC